MLHYCTVISPLHARDHGRNIGQRHDVYPLAKHRYAILAGKGARCKVQHRAGVINMAHIAVLGSGAWGTTLAVVLAHKGASVVLWEHDPARALAMQQTRENAIFLPGIILPSTLEVTADLAATVRDAEVVVFVVPSQRMRANARLVAPLIAPTAIAVSASKGLEMTTLARMSEVLRDILPSGPRDRVAVLSGPNLAREVADGKPAASVVASSDAAVRKQMQELFGTERLRVYSTDDVVGVELGGTLKNVIAIAIGCSDGLGFGDNTKAALMTRGLAEMVRLAVAEGGHPLTLAGLAGLGDLIATCSSPLSRNYSLGRELTSTGKTVAEVLAGRHSVAEGVLSARAAVQMAARHGIEMPVAQALCNFFDGRDAHELVKALMERDPRPERDG
jgi:glycerol-3-phosphate dehydrogenase (NAD(P)+)